MISRNFVVKRIPMGQSKLRCRERAKARAAGRHTGPGKRSGTANARSSSKSAWIFRIRVLRRLLKNYRREGKIDKKLWVDFESLCDNIFPSNHLL